MQIQGPHGGGTKDKIFAQVENGSTSTIFAGALCVWDLTDNSAVSGISENTIGYRVIICPAGYALYALAGFADVAMDATAANTRGQVYLLQVYGHRSGVLVDTAAADNDTIVAGVLIPSTDTAGKVQGTTTATSPNAAESGQIVGISTAIVATNATATMDVLIKGLL